MGEAFIVRRGGGNPLNFRVIGGTVQPTAPRENDIWVNTDQNITSWNFGADEPNVYNMATHTEDSHQLFSPHKLSDGDVLNFVIPKTCTALDWVRIVDTYNGNKIYAIRNSDSTPVFAWPAGTKISVCVSNIRCTMGDITDVPVAYLKSWGSYYHEEGTVWILTGTSSTFEFNALKKNGIHISLAGSNVWNGTNWVALYAYIYQNGTWAQFGTPWDGTIYRNGTEETVITGGLTQKSNVVMTNGYSNDSKIEKKSDRIVLGPAGTGGALLTTVNKVDLTKYNTLTIKGSGNGHAGVHDFDSGNIRNGAVYGTIGSNTNLDISKLTGMYYITFGAYNTDNTYTCYEVYVS